MGVDVILNLGVIDIPYAHVPRGYARNRRHPAHPAGTETTGDVAVWLENKYHIMETFYEAHQNEIGRRLMESLRGTLEGILQGAPIGSGFDPYAAACSAIDDSFKQFLSTQAVETYGIRGVPTEAALGGVNHRKKAGYNKNRARRPSFIDTGLYEASFKSWVT